MSNALAVYAKAVIGAIIAALSVIGAQLAINPGQHLTTAAWVAAAIAGLTALTGVAVTTNKAP